MPLTRATHFGEFRFFEQPFGVNKKGFELKLAEGLEALEQSMERCAARAPVGVFPTAGVGRRGAPVGGPFGGCRSRSAFG